MFTLNASLFSQQKTEYILHEVTKWRWIFYFGCIQYIFNLPLRWLRFSPYPSYIVREPILPGVDDMIESARKPSSTFGFNSDNRCTMYSYITARVRATREKGKAMGNPGKWERDEWTIWYDRTTNEKRNPKPIQKTLWQANRYEYKKYFYYIEWTRIPTQNTGRSTKWENGNVPLLRFESDVIIKSHTDNMVKGC